MHREFQSAVLLAIAKQLGIKKLPELPEACGHDWLFDLVEIGQDMREKAKPRTQGQLEVIQSIVGKKENPRYEAVVGQAPPGR